MNRRQLLLGSAASVAASAIPVNPRMLEGPMVTMSTPSAPYEHFVAELLREIARGMTIPYEQLTAKWNLSRRYSYPEELTIKGETVLILDKKEGQARGHAHRRSS